MMQYAKTGAALLAAAASALIAALSGDQTISAVEWVNIATAIATAASVFTAPNVPGAHTTKFNLAMIMAGLTIATTIIAATPLASTAWFQALTALAGAAAVYGIKNNPPSY